MAVMTILVDTREQKPYTFDGYPVQTRRETLDTADYTLASFCEYDATVDTYRPLLGVERKSGGDFLSSITHRREAFKNEIKRATGRDDDRPAFIEKLEVVVEDPYDVFENGTGRMRHRDITPNQVTGSVDAWEKHYNVNFGFFDDRAAAEQETFDLLLTWLRESERGELLTPAD